MAWSVGSRLTKWTTWHQRARFTVSSHFLLRIPPLLGHNFSFTAYPRSTRGLRWFRAVSIGHEIDGYVVGRVFSICGRFTVCPELGIKNRFGDLLDSRFYHIYSRFSRNSLSGGNDEKTYDPVLPINSIGNLRALCRLAVAFLLGI